jgi:uncharacterized protein (TIGR00369 family)
MTDLAPKPARLSRIQLAQLMMPEHANNHGHVHGGWIMKLADEAGALASTRHAGRRTVTVAVDRMVFHQPIHIGDLVILDAEVTYVGRTSMEVEVHVTAENPVSGERARANTAHFVYVALDEDRRPVPIPPLIAETPDEQRRMEAARERQKRRLAETDR